MTTLTKAGLAFGLTVGALALGLGGAGFLVSQPPSRADAGIVSTLPVNHMSTRGVETVAFADEQPTETDKRKLDIPVESTSRDQPFNVIAPVPSPTLGDVTNPAALTRATEPASWDFQPRSPLVKRIEQALLKDTEVVFKGNPLGEALRYLQDLHNIEIWIDKDALRGEGIATDSLITLSIGGVSLRSTLSLLLEPLQLDYVIKNEVLFITTRVKADETMETRVYNVARIPHLTPKELVEIIVGSSGVQGEQVVPGGTAVSSTPGSEKTASVAASLGTASRPGNSSLIGANWIETAGERGTAWAGKSTLVIRQTQRVHREIVELLDQLVQEEAIPTKTFTNLGGSLNTPNPERSGGSKPTPSAVSSPIGGIGSFGGFNPATTKAIPVGGDASPKP